MNVRLPDGTVIKNVPDNITKSELDAKLHANGYDMAKLQPQPTGTGSDAIDVGNAVGTGFWRGAARLAGLPVDTVQNVIDLGKAGAGVVYREATGKSVPQSLQVNADRSDVVGSSDWILKQTRKAEAGRLMVDPANPQYEGGYLQTAGGSLAGGVVSPKSLPQLANQAGLAISSATLGKAAADLTGNPALAVTASLAPGAAQLAAGSAARRAVRGGEAGRKAMEQRVQDLNNAGIQQPTLGLASGNQVIGGVENLLQSTPGAVGTMKRARDAALTGMQGNLSDAADLASPTRGSLEAGQAIQGGIRDFRANFKAKQGALYDKLDQHIDPNSPVDVSRTKQVLSTLNEDIPGAPELSKQFKNARIQSIEQAILADSGQRPTGNVAVLDLPVVGKAPEPVGFDLMRRPIFKGEKVGEIQVPGRTVQGGTPDVPFSTDLMGRRTPLIDAKPNTAFVPSHSISVHEQPRMTVDVMGRVVPAAPIIGSQQVVVMPASRSAFSGLGVTANVAPTIPFQAVKKTRTLVGNEIADTNLASSVPRSKWKPLYGALADDMQAAANAAGPDAAHAYKQANDFSRAGMSRLDRVQPFVNPDAPEQSFNLLNRTLGDNTSTFQAVKKTLPEGARGTVAATVIDKLGKATPGQQNAAGDAWSPETFLTNWNRMNAKGRKELFSGFPNSGQVQRDVESAAQAASVMRDTSRMWANPSGTGANFAARATLGLAPLSFFASPLAPLAIGGGLLLSRGLAEVATNPASVKFFASKGGLPDNTQSGLLVDAAQQADEPRRRGLLDQR